jgi:hypothetical protein
MQTEMSSSPAGGLCLSAGKHTCILTYYQIMSTKKMNKKALFLVIHKNASSGEFVPDILPILTVNKTQDARLKTQDLRQKTCF